MSDEPKRELIEWLIDVLPAGWEWLGRPILGAAIALSMLAVLFVAWIAWRELRRLTDGNK